MSALLHQMIDEAALRRPEAPAVRCDGAELSYEALARRANGLAEVLLAGGLERRDRVAVLLRKGLRVPVGFYGTLAAGGTLVPIDPRAPLEQVVRILRATETRHLVTESAKDALARQALAACPEVANVVGLEPGDDSSRSYVDWTTAEEAQSDRLPEVAITDLEPSYVLHTSGSTGTPKLILHTHRSAMSFVEWAADEYRLVPEDRLSNHSSHHTCFATFDYYAAARAGATTVILTPAAMMMPASLAAVLESERVSIWYSVPTALVHLSLRGQLEKRDLSSVRWVLFAGETYPAKHLRRLMQQLPNARFSHVYGSTEVNVCTFYHVPRSDELAAPLPIGRACTTSETLVVDGQLEPVAEGDVGELLVSGSTVMSAYWGDQASSERALVTRGSGRGSEQVFFRTGDRVRTLPDGNLTFVNRADFQVKVRGHRVELEEVEAALLALDRVEEAAVVTEPDGEGSLALHAAIIVDGEEPSQAEILDGLHDLLPAYERPSKITLVTSLPVTATGKIDRKALAERLATPAVETGTSPG